MSNTCVFWERGRLAGLSSKSIGHSMVLNSPLRYLETHRIVIGCPCNMSSLSVQYLWFHRFLNTADLLGISGIMLSSEVSAEQGSDTNAKDLESVLFAGSSCA